MGWACTSGWTGVPSLALKSERVFFPGDDAMFTYWEIASKSGRVDVLRELADAGCFLEKGLRHILCSAGRADQKRVIEYILDHPLILDRAEGQHTLEFSIGLGSVARFKRALAYPSVRPSADGNVTTILAAELGKEEILRLLLDDPRVDPTDILLG